MTTIITLVVPSFPRTSETFIVSKFLGLLSRGYDVKVVCGSSDPKEWKLFPGLSRSEVSALVNEFYAAPTGGNGYTVSMLLTFSAWLECVN